LKGFFRGFTPCIARAFPANAACFVGTFVCQFFWWMTLIDILLHLVSAFEVVMNALPQ
jgi:hypothetical protein